MQFPRAIKPPDQEQISHFIRTLTEGWSINYSRNKARISEKQYVELMKSDAYFKSHVDKYKLSKRQVKNSEGTPLSHAQLKHFNLIKDLEKAERRSLNEERTKAVIESIQYIQVELPETSYSLPRGSR